MYIRLWKRRYVVHNVHQLLFRTRFFVLTEFSVPNGSHIDAHKIVFHLFKCILNLGSLVVCYRPRATLIRHCLAISRYQVA